MSSPNKSVLLGEDKLAANPSLPSVSSPILAPGNRAPKNTPAGRSFDNTDEGDSTENNNNASKVNSNAVAAALDQLKLDTASKDPALKIPGLTAFGELTVEVEELLELHTSKGIETRDQYVLERVALEMKYDAIRLQAQQERAHIVNGTGVGDSSSTAGVPEFWSTCIQNHPQLSTLLGEQDEAALAHLTDIRVTHPAKDYNQGFALEFYFSENAYFTNRVLTKTYHMESLVLKLAEEPELLRKKLLLVVVLVVVVLMLVVLLLLLVVVRLRVAVVVVVVVVCTRVSLLFAMERLTLLLSCICSFLLCIFFCCRF